MTDIPRRHEHLINVQALTLAKKIDDAFCGSYHGTAQRTSRVQVMIIEVLKETWQQGYETGLPTDTGSRDYE